MDADVTFTINGMVFNAKTDKNGIASITLNLNPGTYTVKTSVSGHEVLNNIQIKHILSAKMTVKVKKSKGKTIIKIFAKEHKIKQTIKVKFKFTGKNKIKVMFGSVMKNQKVTVKFKGKKFTVKVNKKGYGKLKLSKKVVKKLKKGKTYKAKVTYKGDKIYRKVNLVVKFNGKKYKVKTNKNGVGKFKVTKKMVKKIRKGKTVRYTVTYKNDSIKRFISVLLLQLIELTF